MHRNKRMTVTCIVVAGKHQFESLYTRTRKTFNTTLNMVHPVFVLAIGRIEEK